LVLAVLLHRAGAPDGEAHPSIAEIAERTGLTERTVTTNLRRLEAASLLTTTRTRGRVSRYQLVVPSDVAPMVGRALDDALARSPLTTTERATFAIVLMHTGASGEAWPSHARIARLAGLSVRAVGGALRRLVARGVLNARQVKPGAQLPTGAIASTWSIVLRPTGFPPSGGRLSLAPSPTSPRSTCRKEAIDVPSGGDLVAEEEIHGSSPMNEEQVRPRAISHSTSSSRSSDAIDLLLQEYAHRLELDELGRDAEQILRARVAESSIATVQIAITGIQETAWRMERASRRTVLAALGTPQKFRAFVERGHESRTSFASIAVAEMIDEPASVSSPLSPPPPEELRVRAGSVATFLDALAPPRFTATMR
jgi:DNA-binding Lrp family transcriptional regulator